MTGSFHYRLDVIAGGLSSFRLALLALLAVGILRLFTFDVSMFKYKCFGNASFVATKLLDFADEAGALGFLPVLLLDTELECKRKRTGMSYFKYFFSIFPDESLVNVPASSEAAPEQEKDERTRKEEEGRKYAEMTTDEFVAEAMDCYETPEKKRQFNEELIEELKGGRRREVVVISTLKEMLEKIKTSKDYKAKPELLVYAGYGSADGKHLMLSLCDEVEACGSGDADWKVWAKSIWFLRGIFTVQKSLLSKVGIRMSDTPRLMSILALVLATGCDFNKRHYGFTPESMLRDAAKLVESKPPESFAEFAATYLKDKTQEQQDEIYCSLKATLMTPVEKGKNGKLVCLLDAIINCDDELLPKYIRDQASRMRKWLHLPVDDGPPVVSEDTPMPDVAHDD